MITSVPMTLAICSLAYGATSSIPGEYFYVGGKYEEVNGTKSYSGQMYVQHFKAGTKRFPYPVVMVHGTGQSGVGFLGTPDGRPGWVKYFVENGFDVYVVDQPARARSSTSPSYGDYKTFPIPTIQYLLSKAAFPQAKLHSQWPGGEPEPGNAAFDQFMASQVPFLGDSKKTEELNLDANLALFKKIGPAIYLSHSQSGAFGWKLADSRPDLVKGLVAIEPNGPPFRDVSFPGGDPWFVFRSGVSRPYGLTRLPLTFEPQAGQNGLAFVEEKQVDFPGAITCLLQKEPARALPVLKHIPILILTGEASFRATYDHCTSKFLTQAGVSHTHIRLEDKGVKGNSHMLMLELNNQSSAKVIMDWLSKNIK